jgi:pyridoxamine 5'-phosphate oxidase family protein
MPFTEHELAYLKGQPLGRLATIGPAGEPQNRPVTFTVNTELGTIDIGGYSNRDTQKWRNILADPRVSLLVDDLASLDPWTVRGVEVRGRAEAIFGQTPRDDGLYDDTIRIHPTRIVVWGAVDPDDRTTKGRNIS